MRTWPWLGVGVSVVLLSACGRDDSLSAGPSSGSPPAAAAVSSLLVAQSSLLPTGDAAGRRFGRSIATSDDARVVVVGAPDDSLVAPSAGAAHVFVRSAGLLTEVAALRPTSVVEADQFGTHVAVSGDGTRIAVGAPFAGTVDGGAVYVFRDVAGVWTEESVLVPATNTTGDDVSPVSLDATGSTLLLGAPNASTASCLGCGAAFVFTRDATGWSESASLVSPSPAPFERMGQAVAISRDGARAIVGIPREDTVHVDTGGARTFVRSGATWTHEALLTHGDPLPSDLCGLSVATNTAGDRVAIGCPLDDTAAGTNAGTIRVFALTGSVWSADTTVALSDGALGDQLGYAVAMTPDGWRLVGGAIGDVVDVSGVATGSVRVFDRVGAQWRQGGAVSVAGLGEDALGRSVAVAADGVTVLAGADMADTAAGESAGAAWSFVLTAERGEPCARDAYCATGACVDGVCCDSACGGGALDDCQACSAALTGGVDGTCAALDATAAAATVCRAVGGDCDLEERCVAGATACPSDVFVAVGNECRAARGTCDLVERCTGSAAACPDDAIATAGTSCRPPAGLCDAPEVCDGASVTCPMDRPLPEATGCGDGNACNGEERCTLGVCVVAVLLDCDDDDVCTADACDAALGCSHTDVDGCCRLDADCADGEMCTDDLCDVATGACMHPLSSDCGDVDAGPVIGDDAAIDPLLDAGPIDAAVDPTRDGGTPFDAGRDHDAGGSSGGGDGCGCRVTSTERSGSASALVATLVFAMGFTRARRRRAPLGSARQSG